MFPTFIIPYLSPLAIAVMSVTEDPHEVSLLLSIAAHESGDRVEVWRCDVKGDAGRALGAFQIHPRSSAERVSACGPLVVQAGQALVRVRESLELCAHLPEPERLAEFASGSCNKGRAASRRRWVP